MSETLLPIYASLQAADKTGEAVDEALPESTPTTVRGAIEGGASGAVGGATFGAAAAGQKLAGRAITTGVARLAAPAGYVAVASEEATLGAAGALTGVQTTSYAVLAASEEAALAVEGAVVAEKIGLALQPWRVRKWAGSLPQSWGHLLYLELP